MAYENRSVIDEEVKFGADEELVSTTDQQGVITYANEAFCRVAGYSSEELIGQHHNIVRHPDMPKAAFKDLWAKLKAGQHWRGAVKNRCKDGRYYWVDAFVTPVFENDRCIGYQSVRTVLSDDYRRRAEVIYGRLNQGKTIEYWYHQLWFRHLLYVLCVLGVFFGSLKYPLAELLLVFIPFVIYRHELLFIPNYFRKLRDHYDSPSRWVFSGHSPQSICEFHTLIYKGRMQTILGRLLDSTRPIAKATSQLADSAQQAQNGVSQQRDELHQISVAMEQMVQTIHEIAKSTQFTTTKVNEAQQACQHANEVMDETGRQIESLSDEVTQSADSAQQLNDEAAKIEAIMIEIQGISEQTNLLALNAAIEAARAGDSGRGFAVVADEVRALSHRSHRATEQIQTSISEIQTTLRSWVRIMESSKESALVCVEQTQQTKQSTLTMMESVSTIADLATQISAAAEEQNTVSSEINGNVHQINDVAGDSLRQSEYVSILSGDIAKRVAKVEALAKTFGS